MDISKDKIKKFDILLAEDSPTQAMKVVLLLEKNGFCVSVAANGKEALAIIKQHKPKIVLTDIMMPEMDGFELCKKIKGDVDLKNIPVILLTSLTESQDVLKGLECSADHFITKPFDEQYFLTLINRVLLNRQLSLKDRSSVGIEIVLGNRKFLITSERIQILNLLLSTYEAAISKNTELIKTQNDLETLNASLEEKVKERTLELREEIEERKRVEKELTIKNRLADIFLTVPDDEMYGKVLPVLLEAMESKYGVFGYIDENGALVVPSMTRHIWDNCQLADKRFVFPRETWGDSTWHQAIREKRTIHSNEPSSNVPEGHIGISRHISLPVIHHGEVIGLVQVANKETDYDEKDMQLLETITGYIASVLNARLQRDRQEKARRRAEEALRESEAKFRALVETTSMATFIHQGGHYCYVNPAMEKISGYTQEELLAMNYWNLIHPESRDFVRERGLSRLRGEPMPSRYETAVLTKNGEKGWIDLSVCAIEFEGQSAVLGTFVDITERKRAEETLKKSERLYRGAIEAAGAVPYYQNYITNQYEFVGEGILEMTGYSPEEFTPEEWVSMEKKIVPLGHLVGLSVDEAVKKARSREGINWLADYRVKTRTGEERWLANAAIQVRDDRGNVVGSLGIFQDITERKQMEEQLRQSQKMEAIGQLAGGVAHDFNNLVMVIKSYSDFALKSLKPEGSVYKDIEEIKKAGERASSLTRQLLAFSRRQVLQPKILCPNDLLVEMDKMLSRLIGEDIELVTKLNPSVGQVKADPGQIEQIIMNLAVNARDAMPKGGNLTIETANVDLDESYTRNHIDAHPGPHVMLAVSDTGCGMNAETRAQIFEPFFTTKEHGKGTGMGLATVYGIVKQSGGYIYVYSEEGEGTTFKIYLPREEVNIVTVEDKKVSVESLQGTETILLVEDEKAVRNVVSRTLIENGYTVLEAGDGSEALQIYKQYESDIHLLLTDVIMPGMSGRKMVDSVQSLSPKIKVIYMSGYTDNAIVQHGVLEKGVVFLQKPIMPDDLLRKVREVLDAPGK